MEGRSSLYSAKQKVHAQLNGVFQAASIVQVLLHPNQPQLDRYYVQWAEHDRRMDQWLFADAIRAPSTPSSSLRSAKAKASKVSTIGTRRTSRPDTEETVPAPLRNVNKGAGASHRVRAGSSYFSLPKNIFKVVIGQWELPTWYFSPYHLARPQVRSGFESCSNCITTDVELSVRRASDVPPADPLDPNFVLHLCPYCVSPYYDAIQVGRHLRVCARTPPGLEIYRDLRRGGAVMFEVDGKDEPAFCQRLGLLSKLFLEHKALDYDTSPFIYYVLTMLGSHGCEVVGYFSREKDNSEGYNLSCITTLPHFQGKGAGRFLIDVSYEMSRRCGTSGSPEKPLSDLGERTYRGYWHEKVMEAIVANEAAGTTFSTESLARQTGIAMGDIVATLQSLHLLDSRSDGSNEVRLQTAMVNSVLSRKLKREGGNGFLFQAPLLSWNPEEYLVMKQRNDAPSPQTTVFVGCDNDGSVKDHHVGSKRQRDV